MSLVLWISFVSVCDFEYIHQNILFVVLFEGEVQVGGMF